MSSSGQIIFALTRYSTELSQVLDDNARSCRHPRSRPRSRRASTTDAMAHAHLPVFASKPPTPTTDRTSASFGANANVTSTDTGASTNANTNASSDKSRRSNSTPRGSTFTPYSTTAQSCAPAKLANTSSGGIGSGSGIFSTRSRPRSGSRSSMKATEQSELQPPRGIASLYRRSSSRRPSFLRRAEKRNKRRDAYRTITEHSLLDLDDELITYSDRTLAECALQVAAEAQRSSEEEKKPESPELVNQLEPMSIVSSRTDSTLRSIPDQSVLPRAIWRDGSPLEGLFDGSAFEHAPRPRTRFRERSPDADAELPEYTAYTECTESSISACDTGSESHSSTRWAAFRGYASVRIMRFRHGSETRSRSGATPRSSEYHSTPFKFTARGSGTTSTYTNTTYAPGDSASINPPKRSSTLDSGCTSWGALFKRDSRRLGGRARSRRGDVGGGSSRGIGFSVGDSGATAIAGASNGSMISDVDSLGIRRLRKRSRSRRRKLKRDDSELSQSHSRTRAPSNVHLQYQSLCKVEGVFHLWRTRFIRLSGTTLECHTRDLRTMLWSTDVQGCFVSSNELSCRVQVFTVDAKRPIVFFLASEIITNQWSTALNRASISSLPMRYSQKTARKLHREQRERFYGNRARFNT